METYVEGKLGSNMLAQLHRLKEETEPLGYRFNTIQADTTFTKLGRIESVINELLPICDSLGLDVDDLSLVELSRDNNSVRSVFEDGEIDRD